MELNTDLTMTSGNTDYRGDIMMSTQDLGIVANRSVVQFKTDLTITSFSDDTLVSEMKTDLIFSNNTMMFSVIDYAEVRKSILYFSKFFNVNFEEAYLWKMLASGTSEQINKSHLADVYTAINNLAAKLNNFLEGTDSDNIINTWKELQEFLKGITGVQDLYSLIKSMVTYENIMPLIQDHFLRKDKDDTTAYNLTFANSAKGAGITLGDKFEPGVTGGRINAYYDRNNTLQTSVEVDYLTVRKKATFTQLTIEELKSVGGSIILSPAAMECSRVEILTLQQSDIDAITQGNKYLDSETGEYKTYCQVGDIVFRCYFTKEDEDGTEIINQFVAGDQAKCQTFNASNIYDYTDTSDLSGNRYYWRLVVNTGEDFIDLSQNDKDTGSDVPVLGDTIVQLGHRHDPTRQAAQIISAYGSDAPSHRMYQGVGTTMYFASNVEGEAGYTSGPYDLYGKDVYGLYYNVDSATPGNSKMMQYTYGDWYVGTRNRNHRDSDTTYIKFDTEKKQLSLRGVLVQSQYGDEPQPIEYYRGTYTLENPNCDLFPYYWMDTVTYVSPDGIVGTYIHTGKTTTIGVRPDDTSVWTPKVLGSRGESAITFDLSNEIDAVALDSEGKTLGDETLETTINFHVGLTKISPLKSVSYTLPTGWVDLTDKTTYLTTGKLSFKILQGTVVSNRVIVDITVSITYNSIDYTDTKTYTLTGVEGGANVKLYSLSLSDSVVAYNPNSGVYTPEQITITKKVREGGSAPLSTKEGKVLCEFLMPDGSTITEQIDEITESKIIDVNKEFTKLVVSYYVSNGGTYVRQDQETIPFLREGKDSSLKPYLSYYFAYSSQSVSSTFTTPPKDLDVWTEERHPYWYNTPPEYPLPQTETGGVNYYLWMCVVYYKVNSTNTGWEVDTVDHPVTYTRVEGEVGPSGPDGTKSPYTEYSFAYSTDLSTASSTTEPVISGSWNDGTPEKPSDYDTVKYYLWMKVQKMKATIDNSGWEKDGLPTYARVDGEKGMDGSSNKIADLTNDADYIMVGSDGILNNLDSAITVTTTAILYDGTDPMILKDCIIDTSELPSNITFTKSFSSDKKQCIITGTLTNGTEVLKDEYKIPVTLLGDDTAGTSRLCTYTLAFVKKGADGEAYNIVPSVNNIKYYVETGTFSNSTLTCKVYKKSGKQAYKEITGGVSLMYYVDSDTKAYTYDLATQTSLYPSIAQTDIIHFYDHVKFVLLYEGTIIDTETVYIVKDGKDGKSAYNLTLTNDNASINADSEGNILAGAIRPECIARLYYGTTEVTDAIYSLSTTATGVSINTSTGTLTFSSDFNFSGTSVEIIVSASLDGNVLATKTMTVSKSMAGTDGQDAVSYWLVLNYSSCIYNQNDGTVNPSTLTAKAYKQVGENPVVEITNPDIVYTYISRGDNVESSEHDYSNSLTVTKNDCLSYCKIKFSLKVNGNVVDFEDVDLLKDGKNGGDGSDGDSVMLAYRNSPKMPDTPAQGTAYPPEGWRRTVAVSGTYLVEVVTTQTLSGKSTKDFTLTRVTDKTSAYYGYYQIQGSEAHNTLQCVKVSVKSSELSAYNVDVNVKTNNEDGSDWAYVGKLDMDVSTVTTEVTGRVSGQSGNKTFTFNVKDKSTHSFYIYYVKDLSVSKYTDSVYFKISSSTSENFVEEGTLYSCTGYKNGKTGIITWDTPVLSDYGESPIYSYCGDWVSTQQYWGNNEMIHIVSVAKYTTNGTLDSRTYYKAVRGAGNIPIGVAPESVQVYKYLDITTYTTIEGTTTESTSRYNRSDTTKDITITVDEVSTAYYSWICGDTILYTKVTSGVLGIKLYTYDSSTTTMTELDTKVKRVTSYGDPYFGATYWVKISQYSSMATNLLLADTAILDKATVRSLLTADSPEARIDIRENKLSLYSKDNLERLTIIGDNISGTGTPQYYNVNTTKTTTIKGPASGTESWSVVSFVVNTDNTKVTIPTIEFGWDALVQGDGGYISYDSLVRIELIDGTTTYKSVEAISEGSLGTTSVLLSTFSINLNAGTYYVKVSAVYDIEPQEMGSIAITTYTKAQEPVVVSINSASDNKISIGANGLVANLGNDFSVQMLKENGESKIILLGANTSGNAVGIKISSAGVEYSQDNDWQLLSSGGGSSSSSGNVRAGVSLTSGGIILGNGGYNVKPSSYIPSETWIDNSEVALPSCKAIEDYVKNNSGSSPSGLTSIGLSVPTGLTITGSPLTSNGTLKVTYSSGYSIPKTSDVNKGVEAYDNQYMMLAAPPVLQVIRTYNYSNVKEEFLKIFHPLLANHEYSAVLMVYSKNKKFIRRDSSGTAYYKRKRGWSLALGDFMASYSHYPLEVLGGLSEGIAEITLDELRNHIIPRYAEWQGVDTTTMTYSAWTADSTTTARGFSSGYAEHKKFGVAIRKTNPEFTAIATASTLKDNTMSLQDSSGRIVYRYLYSAVAPLDAYFSSDSSTQNKRYLYFGVACK